jgi:hypothetical protein
VLLKSAGLSAICAPPPPLKTRVFTTMLSARDTPSQRKVAGKTQIHGTQWEPPRRVHGDLDEVTVANPGHSGRSGRSPARRRRGRMRLPAGLPVYEDWWHLRPGSTRARIRFVVPVSSPVRHPVADNHVAIVRVWMQPQCLLRSSFVRRRPMRIVLMMVAMSLGQSATTAAAQSAHRLVLSGGPRAAT